MKDWHYSNEVSNLEILATFSQCLLLLSHCLFVCLLIFATYWVKERGTIEVLLESQTGS